MVEYDGMQWYDWVRVTQSVIAIAGMYFLGRAWVRRSGDYSARLKDFWWFASGSLFVFAVGPLEQLLRGREESWTLWISLMLCIVALKASLSKSRDLLIGDNGR